MARKRILGDEIEYKTALSCKHHAEIKCDYCRIPLAGYILHYPIVVQTEEDTLFVLFEGIYIGSSRKGPVEAVGK